MVNKWLVLVSLLLGEIPPMSDFFQKGMKAQLHPYFQVTKAVRRGDLNAFKYAFPVMHPVQMVLCLLGLQLSSLQKVSVVIILRI